MSDQQPRARHVRHQRHTSRSRLRDTVAGYLFIAPSAVIIGVFGLFPVIFTVYVSLFRWRLKRGRFSGLDNFIAMLGSNLLYLCAVIAAIAGVVLAVVLLRRRDGGSGEGTAAPSWRGRLRCLAGWLLLAGSLAALAVSLPFLASMGDKAVYDALRVTIWYCICTVPVQLVGGVLLALLLTRDIRGRQAFRVVYLMPYIAPTVATAAIFELLFSLRPDSFANQVMKLFGSPPLQWLQEPKGLFTLLFGAGAANPSMGVVATYWSSWVQGPSLALTSIVIYSWWVFIGYYALIYINGLSAIPRQLYEAAEVDGASKARSFFSITVPLLSPTTYFLTLLGVIGTFKAFTHLYVLRSAAAAGTVDPLSVTIFFTAFRMGNLGYASALSLLLFVIVLGLTVIQQRAAEKGVTYGD
jgi:multiple sugar transport system permease protein